MTVQPIEGQIAFLVLASLSMRNTIERTWPFEEDFRFTNLIYLCSKNQFVARTRGIVIRKKAARD